MPNPIDPIRPYVPPEAAKPVDEDIRFEKPWMVPRLGESEQERMARLLRTCYRCGNYNEDPAALSEHENDCAGAS